MKKTFFVLLLFIFALNLAATTIKFERADSLHSRSNGEKPKGKSGTVKIKNQLFQIGVFEFNDPDGIDEGAPVYRFMAIYRIDSKIHSFYNNYHYINQNRLRYLKYLYLEGDLFHIISISNDSMVLKKIDFDPNVFNDPVNVCFEGIFNLNYYDSKFTDSHKNKISFSELYDPDKLNVVYFTMEHCIPCEQLKPEIIKLYNDNKVNLIIATPDSKYNSGYDSIQRKFYFTDSNLNRQGYPEFLIFDKVGDLIPSTQLKGGALAYIKKFQDTH